MGKIGKTIKALKALGYSQSEIARRAKVSQMTISRWEHREPTLVNLVALNRMEKFLEKVKHDQV